MEPIKNCRCNFTYLGPTADIGDLHCQRENGVVWSFWKPTKQEIEMLQNGGTVVLGIYREPIPPVSLGIEFTADDMSLKDATSTKDN